jgi:thymidylate kinase
LICLKTAREKLDHLWNTGSNLLDAISHVRIIDEFAPNFEPDITLLIDPKAESAVRQRKILQ